MGKRILRVAAWCFTIGWAAYFLSLILIYHVFAPSVPLPGSAWALASDEETVALAQVALRKAGEDPAGFAVHADAAGGMVKRSPDKPDEAAVEFRSTQADLRAFRVTLIRKGQDVICRVVLE